MEVCLEVLEIFCHLLTGHVACFNTTTGDVEDAPAPDPLGVFTVSEKDGAVYVKGEEKCIKDGRRSQAQGVGIKPQSSDKVLVVGGYVACP